MNISIKILLMVAIPISGMLIFSCGAKEASLLTRLAGELEQLVGRFKL